MKRLFWAMLAVAGAMYAADVTGTWTGPMTMTKDGETKDDSAHLILKQDGGTVTGSMGPNADQQYNISKGTIDGNKVRLEAVVEGENKFIVELTLENEKLTGNLKTEGPSAPPITGKMTLEKKK